MGGYLKSQRCLMENSKHIPVSDKPAALAPGHSLHPLGSSPPHPEEQGMGRALLSNWASPGSLGQEEPAKSPGPRVFLLNPLRAPRSSPGFTTYFANPLPHFLNNNHLSWFEVKPDQFYPSPDETAGEDTSSLPATTQTSNTFNPPLILLRYFWGARVQSHTYLVGL